MRKKALRENRLLQKKVTPFYWFLSILILSHIIEFIFKEFTPNKPKWLPKDACTTVKKPHFEVKKSSIF